MIFESHANNNNNLRTLMDNTITGNSSSFYCGPDTNIKYQKVQKSKNKNDKLQSKTCLCNVFIFKFGHGT